ncbi:MAG: hypothetical protein ACRDSJ_15090 [Rubrobacteraceae bacterium]
MNLSFEPMDDLRKQLIPRTGRRRQVDALARTLAGCAPTDGACENGDRPGHHIDSLVISGGGNDA